MSIRRARNEDIEEIARIYIDTWKTTYQGLVPDPFLDSLSYHEAEMKWLRFLEDTTERSFIYVACNEYAEIIGFAAARMNQQVDPFEGELYALYLSPATQRLGIGKRLISAVATHFLSEQISSMMVWVMKKNQSGRGFYQRLGGEYYGSRESQFGEHIVEDEAFGWKDIYNLINA